MDSNTDILTANTRVVRYDKGDETTIDNFMISYIKNPETPYESEAEEL
jgi:hypothetical protein